MACVRVEPPPSASRFESQRLGNSTLLLTSGPCAGHPSSFNESLRLLSWDCADGSVLIVSVAGGIPTTVATIPTSGVTRPDQGFASQFIADADSQALVIDQSRIGKSEILMVDLPTFSRRKLRMNFGSDRVRLIALRTSGHQKCAIVQYRRSDRYVDDIAVLNLTGLQNRDSVTIPDGAALSDLPFALDPSRTVCVRLGPDRLGALTWLASGDPNRAQLTLVDPRWPKSKRALALVPWEAAAFSGISETAHIPVGTSLSGIVAWVNSGSPIWQPEFVAAGPPPSGDWQIRSASGDVVLTAAKAGAGNQYELSVWGARTKVALIFPLLHVSDAPPYANLSGIGINTVIAEVSYLQPELQLDAAEVIRGKHAFLVAGDILLSARGQSDD